MSSTNKIKLLIPIVIVMFLCAYGRHRKYNHQNYVTGRLPIRAMDEISGIAASGINPDIYYVHNDSGDTSRFFAILPTGKLKSTIYFKGDPRELQAVHDCEDIAVGPGPAKGKSYVY